MASSAAMEVAELVDMEDLPMVVLLTEVPLTAVLLVQEDLPVTEPLIPTILFHLPVLLAMPTESVTVAMPLRISDLALALLVAHPLAPLEPASQFNLLLVVSHPSSPESGPLFKSLSAPTHTCFLDLRLTHLPAVLSMKMISLNSVEISEQ